MAWRGEFCGARRFRFALAALGASIALALACTVDSNNSKYANGAGCAVDAECLSGYCDNGRCSADADAGCALPGESPGPRTFTCPMGTQCDDNGTCVSTAPAPLPVCGSTDPSNGYDAGSGPGPQSGATCAECVGCPRGSECVCGVAGVRCANAGADLACFVTGAIGTCQVFPGDCATNDQCRSTPATPVCSPDGNCVECLRDSDCRQDGGLQGCVQRRCGPCCRMNADCPVGSMCASGFCYACDGDAGCNKGDGGAQLADGGAPPDAGSPTDASDTGSFPDATTDAVDATGG